MNKNSIIGFILIAAILVGWMIWVSPSKEELAERQRVADSIRAANEELARIDSIRMLEEEQESQAVMPVDTAAVEELDSIALQNLKYETLRRSYGRFASSSEGEERTWTIENKLVKLDISSKGGNIHQVELKNYRTYDSLPLINFDPETELFNLSFFDQENKLVNTSEMFFEPYLNGQPYTGGQMTVREGDSIVFAMRLFADDAAGNKLTDKYIEYQYIVKDDDYMFDFNVNLVGMNDVIARNTNFLTLDWNVDVMQTEKSVDRFTGSSVYYMQYSNNDVDHLNENKDDEETIQVKLKWLSFKQRFFCNALIAKDAMENAKVSSYTKKKSTNPRYLKSMTANIELPYDATASVNSIPMSFYFGPNHFQTLKKYGLNLQRQVNVGSFFLIRWINYGVIYVFDWLGSYGWSYGIVILILTLIIKVILFPIAFKSYKSTAVTRLLKPDIEAINAKYPKEEDMMKKQQAILTLQKQAGVSPAAGCVPMLLQMPILFAVFRFFPSSIELRQQSFLWAEDLSTYDSVLDLPFRIPGYGDHVSLFCLLMTITTFIYTYVNNKQMDTGSNPQMKGMKIMMYLMPILFLGIFNSYSSGLSYYYMLANIITFIQMFLFRKLINEDKIREKIEIAKKQPVKKSAFQKRLEAAQKAAQQQQRKK